jgi:hypothetical protein
MDEFGLKSGAIARARHLAFDLMRSVAGQRQLLRDAGRSVERMNANLPHEIAVIYALFKSESPS